MSGDLVQFLRDRLDDEEQVARKAGGDAWRYDLLDRSGGIVFASGERPIIEFNHQPERQHAMDRAAADFHQAAHIARHDPARVLREVEVDRGLLGQYERLLRAEARHKALAAEVAVEIEREERTGDSGDGLSPERLRALRREADYLPAMLNVLEGWAKAKAAVYADRPGYRQEWGL